MTAVRRKISQTHCS